MLLKIKHFLIAKGSSNLQELSAHFTTPPSAIEGMMSHWINKGCVVKEKAGCQKSCSSCATEQLEVYRWVTPQKGIIPLRRVD